MARDWTNPNERLCAHPCPNKATCRHAICCKQHGIRAAVAAAAVAAAAQAQVQADITRCTQFEIEANLGDLGVAAPIAIPEAFDSIPTAELRNIAQAIEQWQNARNQTILDRTMVRAAAGFSGSQQDNDVFGSEDPDRPTFDHYSTCENTLLTSMQIRRDLAIALIAARRQAWQNVTSGQWLGNLFGSYNADVTAQTAKLASLPGIQAAAVTKLDERRRRAGPDLGPNWAGSWQIGNGTFGAPQLWIRQDRLGNVEDRVVIKDTDFRISEVPNMWEDVNLWTGNGPDDADSVHNEIQSMYNLRGKIGSETILKIRNWKVSRVNRSYRTITEYCPGGDLFDVTIPQYDTSNIIRYWMWPTINLRDPASVNLTQAGEATLDAAQLGALAALRANPPAMVPEPFVWSVIETLATAGLLMERGELDTGGIAPWDQIVHCDIKHENFFISSPNPQRYAGYPQLKLGDFGMALLLKPNDTRVPDDFEIRGTPANMAPEQHKYTADDTRTPRMMSPATNVYGMGAVVWQMLSGRAIPHPTGADGRELPQAITDPQWIRSKGFVPPALDATALAFYSAELVALIYAMCLHDDQARPTCDQILRRVHRFLDSAANPAPGLREAPAGDQRYQGQHRLPMPVDRYAVGLALNAIPMGSFDGDAGTFPPPFVVPPP